VLGVTKAGKSTLLNKLIGQSILISNETRATAAKWTVDFHQDKNYKLRVHRKNRNKENSEFTDIKTLKNACQKLNNDNDIDKICVSMSSKNNDNLDLKLIDLPGLDDQAKAEYINYFIDTKKEILNPIFVINLTAGGSTTSSSSLNNIVK